MLVIKAKEKGNDDVLYLVFKEDLHLNSNAHLLMTEAGNMLLSHGAKKGEYTIKFEEECVNDFGKGTGIMVKVIWSGDTLTILPKEI